VTLAIASFDADCDRTLHLSGDVRLDECCELAQEEAGAEDHHDESQVRKELQLRHAKRALDGEEEANQRRCENADADGELHAGAGLAEFAGGDADRETEDEQRKNVGNLREIEERRVDVETTGDEERTHEKSFLSVCMLNEVFSLSHQDQTEPSIRMLRSLKISGTCVGLFSALWMM